MHSFNTDDPPRVRKTTDFINCDWRFKWELNPRVMDSEEEERTISSIVMMVVTGYFQWLMGAQVDIIHDTSIDSTTISTVLFISMPLLAA